MTNIPSEPDEPDEPDEPVEPDAKSKVAAGLIPKDLRRPSGDVEQGDAEEMELGDADRAAVAAKDAELLRLEQEAEDHLPERHEEAASPAVEAEIREGHLKTWRP